MNRNKELAKNTIIIALGKICTQFVTFFLLPVYTHFLSTAEYGTVDMVATCTSLIAPILSLQLERATFRFLVDARSNKEAQDRILSTAFTTIVPPIILIMIGMPVLGLFFGMPYWQYIELIIISAIISNIALQIPRGLGSNLHFSIGSMAIGVSNAAISIISVVYLHMGITGVLLANIISHCIGAIYICISMKIYKQVRLSKRSKNTLKELLKFSIPMIPNDISYWVISISDRLLIYLFLADSFNGIYATSTKFPTLLVTAYNVFNMSWMETVSAHIDDSDAEQYLSKTYNMIIRLFASICMIATAAVPFVFDKVIGDNFAESYKYIAVLIFGAFFNIMVGMLGSIYIGYKKTKEMARTTMLAAIINIVVNILLIWQIGIWAAVYSTLAAYAIVTFLRLLSIQKTIHITTDRLMFMIIILLFVINVVLFSFENLVFNAINLATMSIAALLLNREFIRKTIPVIMSKVRR